MDPSGQFAPFKARVERELTDRADAFKRTASFAGNLFSSDTIQNLGDVQSRGQDVLTEQLANLANRSLDRKVSAAGTATGVSGLIEQIQQGRIASAIGFGGVERNLQNQGIAAQRGEILRRRDEELSRINAATGVLSSSPQFGVRSLNIPQPSPFQGVLDLTARLGGDIIGNELSTRRGERLLDRFDRQPRQPRKPRSGDIGSLI